MRAFDMLSLAVHSVESYSMEPVVPVVEISHPIVAKSSVKFIDDCVFYVECCTVGL